MSKRYEVRDQNGDVLYESDVWAHAVAHFRSWVTPDVEASTACVFDMEYNTAMLWADEVR